MQSTALSLKQWNKLCGANATNMPFTRQCPHRSYRNNQPGWLSPIYFNQRIYWQHAASFPQQEQSLPDGGNFFCFDFWSQPNSQCESPTIKCNKNLTFLLLAAIHLAATVRSLAGETHLPIFQIKSWRKIRKKSEKEQSRASFGWQMNRLWWDGRHWSILWVLHTPCNDEHLI